MEDYRWPIKTLDERKVNYHGFCLWKDIVPEVVIRIVLEYHSEKGHLLRALSSGLRSHEGVFPPIGATLRNRPPLLAANFLGVEFNIEYRLANVGVVKNPASFQHVQTV